MKDEKNKNLEEFFNRSLEEFNDGPSEQVWEGLAERLEEDMTFFQKWRSQIVRWMPILLLLLGFGTYFIFTQQKLDQLKNEMLSTQQENNLLSINLDQCSKQKNIAPSANEALTENTNSQNEFPSSNELKSTQSTLPVLTDNNNNNNNNSSIDIQVASQRSQSEAIASTNTNVSKAQSTPTTTTENNLLPQQPKAPTLIEAKASPAATTQGSADISSTALSNTPMQALPGLSRLPSRVAARYVTTRGLYGLGIVYATPINRSEEKKVDRYSFGLSSRMLMTTIKDIANDDALGYSLGVKQELKLIPGFSLINGVHFNSQNYSIGNNALLANNVELQRFPSATGLGSSIKKIQVKSNYLDASVGLKFQVFNLRNGTLYVNSSLVWQAYLPQKFIFTTDNNTFEERPKRYIGYFGSTNSAIGFEGKLSHKHYYQIEIWQEHSIIPLGIENQKIRMLGLSLNLLFGNKDTATVYDTWKSKRDDRKIN